MGSSPTSGTIPSQLSCGPKTAERRRDDPFAASRYPIENPRTDLQAELLRQLTEHGRPLAVKELARRLDLDAPARRELKSLLRGLIAEGTLVEVHGARIGLPDRMNLVVGRLSCSPSGYGFVVPDARRTGERDLFLAPGAMGGALHGDRVVARLERSGPRGPEGRIVRVLDRAQQRLVGRYESDGRFGGHLVPFDKRILHEVFVPSGEERNAQSGLMVVAEITRPPSANRNPIGRVVEVLGRASDPGVDLKVILAKHALPSEFPEEVEREARLVSRPLTENERAGRTDFRNQVAFTIDPETARDHDDAVGIEALAGGGWRLAVHIADVAHYVREGGALDQEAYLRGTSVYFPGHVVPMLPHALSSGICSLVDGEDRLTQSVLIEFDGNGRVVHSEFHDGVIRSAARLSYQQAQAIVDGDQALRARFVALVAPLEAMSALAQRMRARRHDRGSLDFDLPEPKLVLDERGEMLGILRHERLDSMRMIEEFMLAANEAVAERLHRAGVGALYRVHERPDPERVEEFAELVASLGCRIPGRLESIRPEHFQAILRQIEGRPEEKLVSYLLLRTMKLARYHEENLGHFGLATDMYAHFTSPIRRYPDLVVHRALRGLGRGGAGREGALRERLPEMGLHLSDCERRAAEAERELVEWKKVRFMASRLGETLPGYVTGVQPFGLFVELEDIFVQGLVHVSSMNDDYYRFDERAHRLRGENTGAVYRLGDRVQVKVARVDQERRTVELVLAGLLARPRAVRPRPAGGRTGEPRPRGPQRRGAASRGTERNRPARASRRRG